MEQGDSEARGYLNPEQVHTMAFSKPPFGKRGYHEDEVDAFVDLVKIELTRRPPGRSGPREF